ncbi:MAG: tail fiber domain-containing protein [Candidatus Delongbacteria bacterium]|nr:tail fiber domain-containing protein [Candidatus Delongbacteria bacterium]MDD4205590.1 tail fiber domain-containing protein [Candidatus Delongbacteria bacterium]
MKYLSLILLFAVSVNAETLFEIKDSSNNTVFNISNDGMRVFNLGDTLMVISANAIRANISSSKGLSRSFSVTTTSSVKGKGLINALQVDAGSTSMSAPDGEYSNFSPLNIFLGLEAGASIGPGKYNVMIGNYAGNGTIGVDDFSYYGWSNTFLGESAGRYATNSSHNVYIGKSSGANNASGGDNTFIGTFSGQNNSGQSNTFIGSSAGGNGTGSGSNNTYLGYLSGAYTSTGSSNLMLGDRAGYNIRTGNNNVGIGYRAGYSNQSGAGNVMLGYEAGFSETGSNKLYIANSNTTTPLIKGTFPNTDLTFTTSRVSIIHPTGTSNGLYFQNTYNGNTDSWHLYMYTDDNLGLFYNTTEVGEWNNSTGVYSALSDKRFKKNISDAERFTEKVMKLQPKRYNFTTEKSDERNHIGLIAQDVIQIFPEFVYYNKETDTYTMDYAGLSVVAIQALKEQQIEINEMKKEIKELKELIRK